MLEVISFRIDGACRQRKRRALPREDSKPAQPRMRQRVGPVCEHASCVRVDEGGTTGYTRRVRKIKRILTQNDGLFRLPEGGERFVVWIDVQSCSKRDSAEF